MTSTGQRQHELDSLTTLLGVAGEDTTKVLLLISLSNFYQTSKQDSSLYLLEKARELSERLNYTSGLYRYHAGSSITYFTKGDYARSMDHSAKALALAKEMNHEDFTINSLINLGIIYQYLGKFDKQLEYTLLGLSLVEKKNDTKKLSSCYHNVGNAYAALKQFRKSLYYCRLAIATGEKYKSSSYTNRIYATIGQNYDNLSVPDSALFFFKIAANESLKQNDKYAEAAIYGFMSDVYRTKNDFVSMLRTSEKSLALSQELQSRQMLASSLSSLAAAQYYNGNQEQSLTSIHEALAIAKADSLRDELKSIYGILSYIAARDSDFKTSLWAKSKTDSLQSADINDEVIKTASELSEKYESEKRDIQIRLQEVQLKEKNMTNLILVGATLSVVVVSVLFFLNYRHRQYLQQQRISELETEKQLFATEAVLKGEEQERTRLAKDLHDGLGGMLSGIKYSFHTMSENLIMTPANRQAFERSMDMLDSSIKEMRRVAHNMMPETLVRFGLDVALKDYCSDINQSGALLVNYQSIGLTDVKVEQTIAITLFRIVQELINNILKHAAAKTAIVQVTKTGTQFTVTVEDDGNGFDTDIIKRAGGMGWSNIRHRIDFLKGKVDVDSQPGKGTSVHIEFNS
jgi:signal transduction histidine kinase